MLEHLDNLHTNFNELIRVTRNHVILSLPNNWANARKAIERGRGSFSHYGLPAEPPMDRHKWFFCLTDAQSFIEAQAKHHRLNITEVFAVEKPRLLPVRWLRRLRHPKQSTYLNRYAHSLWVVCSKQPSSPKAAA